MVAEDNKFLKMTTTNVNESNNVGNNSFNYKLTPPILNKEYGYSNWKYDLKIWEAFTSLEKQKQGLAVFLSLTGQDKQAVRNISIENLSSTDGVKLIIAELDKLYLKDESSLAYEACEKFEKFSRQSEMSINDYVIKFEQLYQIAKSHKMEVLDGVLEEKKQLVRATVNEMKYDIMKEQLKKVFTSHSFEKSIVKEDGIKLEPVDSFYTRENREKESIENVFYNKSSKSFTPRKQNSFPKKNTKSLQNPLDSDGKVSRCRICDSKFHWANKCPDKHSFWLYEKHETIFFEEPNDSLLAETFNLAIIDSQKPCVVTFGLIIILMVCSVDIKIKLLLINQITPLSLETEK